MKKRICIVISTLLLIVVCAVSLVACAPSTLPKFIAKSATAEKFTMEEYRYGEKGELVSTSVMSSDGKSYSIVEKDKDGNVTSEEYYIEKDGKWTGYFNEITNGISMWFKEDLPEGESIEDNVTTAFEIFSYIILKEGEKVADLGEKAIEERAEKICKENDGKWTLTLEGDLANMAENIYFTLKSGKLEGYAKYSETEFKKMYMVKLSASKISLPKGAENAIAM